MKKKGIERYRPSETERFAREVEQYRDGSRSGNGKVSRDLAVRRIWFATKILVAVLFVSGLFIAGSVFLKVSRIDVEGGIKYSADEIKAASGIDYGMNMLSFTENAAEQAVKSSLPYVDNVEISRSFPTSVKINVTETVASYCAVVEGGYLLLDKNFKTLEVKEKIPGDLLVLDGVDFDTAALGSIAAEKNSETLQILFDFMSVLLDNSNDIIISGLGKVEITSAYYIQLYLYDRILVKFTSSDELEYKLEYVSYLLENDISPFDSGTIFALSDTKMTFSPTGYIDWRATESFE